ncbi:PREDICTED: putative bifunctional UDP-N-acetylglucosamine transferase and deubiquitinase ALG13 [Lepidothrix coronata]|uniref:UDP-N-acetylglucosamine transferase subunit ALG13 n=1 Tax=Lepidothrix coronata TaxID=321398 RepID=A0A6J0H660_9PASS|nr:PREDICTED: putative bifunctional UDP-N-acetylglucosamine transferase and deubiquitinase ALG13 [Lepidothrix coronata]
MRSVFVTVGTTSFDELIATARSPPALQVLHSRGYQKVVLQVGRGALQLPLPRGSAALEVEAFRFKDSLAEDLRSADLVISHAGAGSCLETLEKGKPLIVVINDKLMNNHQLELAKQLHRDGYVLCCNCSTLVETLQLMDLSTLKPFPPGQPEKFALFLDKVVGFQRRPRAEPPRAELASASAGKMQKGWKKYFGQKSFSEVAMDEYLGSLGLYRKMTAKDASCLFRAVSEQLFSSQIHHLEVRKACVSFMRQHQPKFESYVEGSFEKYLERLGDPKESAGQLEISALSMMYKRDFILYRYPGKPPTYATDNDFEDKILLCCSGNGHYDSVYTKQFQENAAVCQALLYEVLYKGVFGMDEEELRSAVEVFRSGSKKNRNSGRVGSEDANFGCLHEKVSRNPSEKRVDDWECNDADNPEEAKFKQGIEEEKPSENPPKMPVPYKVLKALDSAIYRNVEFDVWLDSRKELQKTDYMVFAGRQYYLGDKCQVRLEPGERYYNAHIQEVGQEGNTLTVFVEELAEKHTVPLANLKPVTQVAPVLAWNMAHNRRGGAYQKITGGHFSGIEMGMKTRKRMLKKVRGKEVFMTVAYSRGQPLLPPRLQHSVPSGRSPPVHCSQGAANMAPYKPYHQQNPQRHHRGFGMLSSYSRSRRRMQCENKECQDGFLAGHGEEPQGPEETVTFYEIEGENDAAFPTLPFAFQNQSSPAPTVHSPAGFWVARRNQNSVSPNKQTLNSSEEEEAISENASCSISLVGKFHEEYIYAPPDPDCETATVFSSAEPTANLVLVNSAGVSASTDVYTAPATGLSSNSAASTPASVTTATPPQTAVQPVIVSPFSVGRPAVSSVPFPTYSAPLPPVSEVGEAGAVLPAYSCDPSGSDLPRDTKVLRYYFNLGLQYCHQSYWPSMVYVQPVLPPSSVEVYPAYAEPAPALDQSVPQVFTDARQTEVQVPLEAPANGNFPNAEPPPPSYGPVYYPVVSDPFSQQSLPGFDTVVPAYHYISTWHPVNPAHGSSPQMANAVSSGPPHQISYIASPNPVPYDMPQGM